MMLRRIALVGALFVAGLFLAVYSQAFTQEPELPVTPIPDPQQVPQADDSVNSSTFTVVLIGQPEEDEYGLFRGELRYKPVRIGLHHTLDFGELIRATSIREARGDRIVELVVATQSGDYLYHAAPSGEGTGSFVLRRMTLFEDSRFPRQPWAPLNCAPTALMAVGDVCYVGAPRRVDMADFRDEYPDLVPVHVTRIPKPVDFFVRQGDSVFAVDDIMRPFFAFAFDLEEDGTAGDAQTRLLPSLINGHYHGGAAYQDRLYLFMRYSHRGGRGQTIFELDAQELPVVSGPLEEFDFDEADIEPTGSLHEGIYRDEDRGLVGELDEWHSIHEVSGRLVIVRESGLALVTLPFADEPELVTIPFDGAVLDAIVRDNYLVVLRSREGIKEVVVMGFSESISNFRALLSVPVEEDEYFPLTGIVD